LLIQSGKSPAHGPPNSKINSLPLLWPFACFLKKYPQAQRRSNSLVPISLGK
jgi:hypothetical protein